MAYVSYEFLEQKGNPQATSLSAINKVSSAIVVVLGGTAIPLATRPYNNGFTANGTNTIFTATQAGSYMISYNINVTVAVALSSGVYINGTEYDNLTRSPALASTSFSATAIVPLNAGDTLQLTLFGLIATSTLQSKQGAHMTVVKLA